jgi:hypothetical protein
MFFRTRPKDYHFAVIEHMIYAGYSNVASGICYGIAGMALQAILQRDTSTYNRRIKFLADTSPIGLQYLKSISLNKWKKITKRIEEKLELDPATKYKSTQYKIELENAFNSLDEKDRDILDMKAFFDGIFSYQSPFDYENLQEHDYSSKTQNIKSSLPLTMTKAIEGNGGIKLASSESGAYTQKEIHTVLEEFRKIYKAHRTDFPIGFVLSNYNHAFTIGLDPSHDRWIFIEAASGPSKLLTDSSMAAKIHEIFSKNKITVINTEIYITGKDYQKAEEIISEWKATDEFGTSHFISSNRAHYTDSDDISLLYVAAQNGNIKTVKELLPLLSHPEINKSSYNCPTALFVAAQNGELGIVKLLLEHHANPLADLKDNGSPLIVAAQKRHVEIMKILLRHGANFEEISDDDEAVGLLLGNETRRVAACIKS